MSIYVDGSFNRKEEYEKIYELNPRIEYICFLPSKTTYGFDKTTGLCAARTVTNYEVALFLEDGGYSVIDGVKYDIHKGSIRFLRPGQTLYSKKFGDFFSLHFSFSRKDEGRIVENDFINSIPTLMTTHNIDSYINLFREMIEAGMEDGVESVLLIKSKMMKFLYALYQTAISYQKVSALNDNSLSIVLKAMEYMEVNLSKDIGLDEISDCLDLHPVYFDRVFSKSVGIPPITYLKDLRLNKAKLLLVTTNLKVAKIAQMCGFSTSSYFIVQFKKKYGSTPSEYRTINNENLFF